MRILITVVVPILFSGGCGGAEWERAAWVKPGVEPGQQRRDQDECEQHARARVASEQPAVLYAECMRTRGYELERFDRPVRPQRSPRSD